MSPDVVAKLSAKLHDVVCQVGDGRGDDNPSVGETFPGFRGMAAAVSKVQTEDGGEGDPSDGSSMLACQGGRTH